MDLKIMNIRLKGGMRQDMTPMPLVSFIFNFYSKLISLNPLLTEFLSQDQMRFIASMAQMVR